MNFFKNQVGPGWETLKRVKERERDGWKVEIRQGGWPEEGRIRKLKTTGRDFEKKYHKYSNSYRVQWDPCSFNEKTYFSSEQSRETTDTQKSLRGGATVCERRVVIVPNHRKGVEMTIY